MKLVYSIIALSLITLGAWTVAQKVRRSERPSFTAGQVGMAPSVASADFYHRGISDLVVVTGGSGTTETKGSVLVFKALGGGRFADSPVLIDQLDYMTSDGGVGVTTGDFNQDGCQDIAVAVVEKKIWARGQVIIYAGDCKGAFQKIGED